MKRHRSVIFIIIFLSVLVPGNILTSDYSRSFIRKALEVSGRFSHQNKYAARLHERLLNDMYLSPTIFEDNHIVAFYGHPKSRIMGIVGRCSITELAELLKEQASSYDSLHDGKGVLPAIYLIYGTCQPGGEINIIDRKLVDKYIKFALENGFLIYLDHQIGKYPVDHALNQLLPYLKYPNVHLAIDVEWRTTRPMREIGSISAGELNAAQKKMRDYMAANRIQGKRQFVIHQFQSKMIRNIKEVKSDYDPVLLVHATSGWGSPDSKISTHNRNALAVNIPYKGFKLWYYYTSKPGVHFDRPLMTPRQVMSLNPEPGLIIYQ